VVWPSAIHTIGLGCSAGDPAGLRLLRLLLLLLLLPPASASSSKRAARPLEMSIVASGADRLRQPAAACPRGAAREQRAAAIWYGS
jgi:hypothetical protein